MKKRIAYGLLSQRSKSPGQFLRINQYHTEVAHKYKHNANAPGDFAPSRSRGRVSRDLFFTAMFGGYFPTT